MTSRPYAEVIGDPIAHSKSPLIHNFWLEKLSIDAEYRTHRGGVGGLPAYLAQRLADPAWRGCNVTMPLKKAVLPLIDRIQDLRVGAVNCIIRDASGSLNGFNTDVAGVREAVLQGQQEPCNNHIAKKFDLIGTGGAARAALVALSGEDVTVFGRTQEKADALSDELGVGATYGYSSTIDKLMSPAFVYDPLYPDVKPNEGKIQRYDYTIINATPLGMTNHPELPIRLETYPKNTVVIDLVYDPFETPLLKRSRELGMTTVDGLWMLIGQAAPAFERFFGQPAPREHDAELRERLTA